MEQDFLPLKGTDYIEFYVGNAKQASLFYQHCFGFELIAYAGPETGIRNQASYVIQQNKIRFVFTSSLVPDSPISDHVKKHGDGVKVLALWVDDATQSFKETTLRGAVGAGEPKVLLRCPPLCLSAEMLKEPRHPGRLNWCLRTTQSST